MAPSGKISYHPVMELRRFQTARGEIWLHGEADAFDGDAPILLALTGEFAAEGGPFFQLAAHLGEAAVLTGHLPGNHCPPLRETSIEAFAAAYAEVVSLLNRPTVVLGESVGALVALAMRSPCLRGQVLLEPPLLTAKLWPLIAQSRDRLSSNADRDLIERVLGYFEDRIEGRDYRRLLNGVAIPTQVFWGSIPLGAPRDLPSPPSLVDEPERAAFRAHPMVRAVTVRDAGHGVILPAGRPIVNACASLLTDFAQAPRDRMVRTVDLDLPAPERALVERTPLTARRVLYVGTAPERFEASLRARHPTADLRTGAVGSEVRDAFDCVAVSSLRAEAVPWLAERLSSEGDLIAVVEETSAPELAALRSALAAAGLSVRAAHNPRLDHALNDVVADFSAGFEGGAVPFPLVLVARKGPIRTPRMVVQLAAYTPFRMDIRTRLPIEGLRSHPDVAVALCGAPAEPLQVPADQPKVLILQRPSQQAAARWRREMARAIRQGWVTVMEIDDHPDLLEQMGGGPADWPGLGLMHAVQTSTPPLEAAFRPRNPEVKVFPNAVFDLAPFPERPGSQRVFYGALRRGSFARDVASSLAGVVAEFPEIEFVVVGDPEIFAALPTARKEFHTLQSYEDYLDLMATCAISLTPIEDAPLLDTKSDGKFLDASSRGLLTIASPTVYDRTIRHGETGLIAERLEDWAPLLTQVLRDEDTRLRMARAAWRYVRDQRMFAHQLPDRMAWYRSLWERREGLTAELAARVPGLAAELAG